MNPNNTENKSTDNNQTDRNKKDDHHLTVISDWNLPGEIAEKTGYTTLEKHIIGQIGQIRSNTTMLT